MMSFADAVIAAQAAGKTLDDADTAQSQAQSAFDAAAAAKAAADTADAHAVTDWNKAMDDVIAAASASKR